MDIGEQAFSLEAAEFGEHDRVRHVDGQGAVGQRAGADVAAERGSGDGFPAFHELVLGGFEREAEGGDEFVDGIFERSGVFVDRGRFVALKLEPFALNFPLPLVQS